MSATTTRRAILAGAATLPALTVPALAVPATSGCTLPSDLIERFLRVRAWFLEKHAQESLHSVPIDKLSRWRARSCVWRP